MEKVTAEDYAEFRDLTAHLSPLGREFVREGLGWGRPLKVLPPTVNTVARAATAPPLPPDLNARIREQASTRGDQPGPRPPVPSGRAASHVAPPPPDFNHRVRTHRSRR